MRPVNTHGAVKIPMNSQESDYRMKLAAAKAQADGNPFVSGIESASPEELTKDSRSAIGAPTKMPQDYTSENFSQGQSAANVPLERPEKTTGSVELGTSATKTPDQDPDAFQQDAKFRRRIDMLRRAVSNADDSNNDRAQTGRLA